MSLWLVESNQRRQPVGVWWSWLWAWSAVVAWDMVLVPVSVFVSQLIFRHSRESGNPEACAVFQDSRFRGNDGVFSLRPLAPFRNGSRRISVWRILPRL